VPADPEHPPRTAARGETSAREVPAGRQTDGEPLGVSVGTASRRAPLLASRSRRLPPKILPHHPSGAASGRHNGRHLVAGRDRRRSAVPLARLEGAFIRAGEETRRPGGRTRRADVRERADSSTWPARPPSRSREHVLPIVFTARSRHDGAGARGHGVHVREATTRVRCVRVAARDTPDWCGVVLLPALAGKRASSVDCR
jgi:hypothetical protein